MHKLGFYIREAKNPLPPGVLGYVLAMPMDHPKFDPKKHIVLILEHESRLT